MLNKKKHFGNSNGLGSPSFGKRVLGGDNNFIMTVDTTKAGSASDTFVLPLQNGATSITVDWGDGNSDVITTYNQSELTHQYSSSGSYQISVDGQFHGINFNNAGDKLKLSSIDNWGANVFGTMNSSFSGCSNMVGTFTDTPDLSSVNGVFGSIFNNCSLFDSDIGGWDMSNVTDLSFAFQGCLLFNNGGSDSIKDWDTSSVATFTRAFQGCVEFNQPVPTLVTLAATNINETFQGCAKFNQDIGGWVMSNVTIANDCFYNAAIFNNGGSDSIKDWDTSEINSIRWMFTQSSFNQPLNWDTSKVTTMDLTFYGCPFDQDIGGFSIPLLTSASSMLANSTLSTANYDALLIGWEGQTHNNNVPFHGGSSTYSAGAAATARAALIADGWTITDGGVAP